MGLGKTLTMLSAILCSKQLAQSFSYGTMSNSYRNHAPLSITLVVLPSRRKFRSQIYSTYGKYTDNIKRCLMFGKMKSIGKYSRSHTTAITLTTCRRFQPHAFKTITFHGDARPKKRELLLGHDIVLTTYHTLEKDNRGKGILNSINWSRVVLDEGKSLDT